MDIEDLRCRYLKYPEGRYLKFIHLMINDCSFISTMELTKVMSDLGERLSEEEVIISNISF